jgi:hypothetical protein
VDTKQVLDEIEKMHIRVCDTQTRCGECPLNEMVEGVSLCGRMLTVRSILERKVAE